MLNQLQRGDEPALLPCRRSGFLRRPYVDMPANKPLEVDRPPDTLCFAAPGFLPATQGQRSATPIA